MIIQINTDSNIEGDAELVQRITAVVSNGLERFSEKLTRVEIHLSDENSESKFGADDKRCLLEARLAGHQPVSVSDQSTTMEQAVNGALNKLKRSLDSTIGRLEQR